MGWEGRNKRSLSLNSNSILQLSSSAQYEFFLSSSKSKSIPSCNNLLSSHPCLITRIANLSQPRLSLPSPRQVAHLRTLPSIRERCSKVFQLAEKDQLDYFQYNKEKMSDVVEFCSGIIKVSILLHDKQLSTLVRPFH